MAVQAVLVVDDSLLTRTMVTKIINGHYPEWDVVQADSAETALAIARQRVFDFVTLDYTMPGQTGLDIYPNLRALMPSSKIALLTANVQAHIQSESEDQDIEFIAKPITEEKILQFVASVEV